MSYLGVLGKTLWPQLYNNVQADQARPVLEQLSDFQSKGWSSDPSFTGDEWTKGLLTTPAFSGTDQMPDMENPNILKAVTGFANQSQKEKQLADLYQGEGLPFQQASQLSRFALDEGVTPHLKALENAPAAFSPPVADNSRANRIATISQATGADPKLIDSMLDADGKNSVSVLKELGSFVPPEVQSNYLAELQPVHAGVYGTGEPGTAEPAFDKALLPLQQKYAKYPPILKQIADYRKGELDRWKVTPSGNREDVITAGQGDTLATKKYQYQVNPWGNEIPGTKHEVTSHARPAKGGMGGNMGRLVQAFDKETRDLVYVNADDIKSNPGRYAPAGAQNKANQQQVLIEDIRGTLNNTMTSLDKMPPFTSSQQAQIALMLKERDPKSAISNFLGSKIGQSLKPEQVDYITDLALLKENILTMRSLLGGGQSSQDQRAAIEATIPAAIQPNKTYAKVQLKKALRTLDRLGRGVPNASLKPEVESKSVDTSRPVNNGKITGYKQPDGSIVDIDGKRLN